jgi:hypothetical protein
MHEMGSHAARAWVTVAGYIRRARVLLSSSSRRECDLSVRRIEIENFWASGPRSAVGACAFRVTGICLALG